MGTPFGQKQVTKFKASIGTLFNYSRFGVFADAKFYGISFLINANKHSAFFPSVEFFITYTLDGKDESISAGVEIRTTNLRDSAKLTIRRYGIDAYFNVEVIEAGTDISYKVNWFM